MTDDVQKNKVSPAEAARRICSLITDPERGRSFAFTQQKLEILFTVLLAENYRHVACRYARISPATFHNYLNRGKEVRERIEKTGETPTGNDLGFLDLLETVEHCEAIGEVSTVMAARKQNALTFLRVRYRERYHFKHQGDEGDGNGAVTPEEAGRIIRGVVSNLFAKAPTDEPAK